MVIVLWLEFRDLVRKAWGRWSAPPIRVGLRRGRSRRGLG